MGTAEERQRDLWDRTAERYDRLVGPLDRRFMAASRRWIGERAVGEVLEVAGDAHGSTSTLSTEQKAHLVSYLLQIDNTAHEDEVEPLPEDVHPEGPTSPASAGKTSDGGGCSVVVGRARSTPPWAVGGLLACLLAAVRARRARSRVIEPA